MLKLILPVTFPEPVAKVTKGMLKNFFSEKVLVFSCMVPTASAIKNAMNA